MKHLPIAMVLTRETRGTTVPTKHYRQGKGFWKKHFTCPTCKALASHLSNFHRPAPVCDGTRKPANSLVAQAWKLNGWQG